MTDLEQPLKRYVVFEDGALVTRKDRSESLMTRLAVHEGASPEEVVAALGRQGSFELYELVEPILVEAVRPPTPAIDVRVVEP